MTTEEFWESAKKYLAERLSSPFAAAFLVAWCYYNYEFLLTLFSSLELDKKIDRLHSITGSPSVTHNFVYSPFWAAILFVALYPVPAIVTYAWWHLMQHGLKWVRKRIDDNEPLRREDEQRLREDMRRTLGEAFAQVSKLRQENSSLQEALAAARKEAPPPKDPGTPQEAMSRALAKFLVPDTAGLLKKEGVSKILQRFVDEGGDIFPGSQRDNPLSVYQQSLVDELESARLVERRGAMLSLTAEGRKALVDIGIAKSK